MHNLDWCRLTDLVILGAVVSLVLYNLIAGVCGGGVATISARMQHYSPRYPVIPMVVGMLAAHWFWNVFGLRSDP